MKLNRNSLLLAIGVIVVGIGWFWFGNRQPEFTRAGANAFCHELLVRESDGQALISEDISLAVGKGIYAVVEFSPKPDRPGEIETYPLEDPKFWRLAVKVYRRTDWPAEEGVKYLGCLHFEDDHRRALSAASPETKKRQGDLIGFGDGADLWTEAAGYHGEPVDLQKIVAPRERRWTLLATPSDSKAGDQFVYEIALFPHAHAASSLRFVIGPHVVLRRGLITVQ